MRRSDKWEIHVVTAGQRKISRNNRICLQICRKNKMYARVRKVYMVRLFFKMMIPLVFVNWNQTLTHRELE